MLKKSCFFAHFCMLLGAFFSCAFLRAFWCLDLFLLLECHWLCLRFGGRTYLVGGRDGRSFGSWSTKKCRCLGGLLIAYQFQSAGVGTLKDDLFRLIEHTSSLSRFLFFSVPVDLYSLQPIVPDSLTLFMGRFSLAAPMCL